MKNLKTGDLQPTIIGNTCLNARIKKITPIDGEESKGSLVSYIVDGYGETGDFWKPDNQILDEQAQRRKNRSMMPSEFVYKRAKDFDWRLYGEDITPQKQIANTFVLKFSDFKKQGRGLYISSATKGSGKTMLACCIANELIQRNDMSVKFIGVSEYIELCKEKSDEAKETLNAIRECSLLVFDDIGMVTDKQEWISNAIFRLIDYRDKNILSTIYTSNYEMCELPIDDRIVSRIEGHSVPLIMPEKSIRRMQSVRRTKEFLKNVLVDSAESIF